jgi:hypothetical protein
MYALTAALSHKKNLSKILNFFSKNVALISSDQISKRGRKAIRQLTITRNAQIVVQEVR